VPIVSTRACRQIEPENSGSEVDGSQEIAGGLVVARGDRSELLEFAEEIFDQVARLVELPVEIGQRLDGVAWAG